MDNSTPDPLTHSTAILVVESNTIVRTMLRRALERRNHDVLMAANAESALALFQHAEEPIGLVVSEQRLSGMDGTALADELRRHDPDIPILLVESGFPGMCGEYLELDKPFTPAKLEQRLNDVVGAPSVAPLTRSPSRA